MTANGRELMYWHSNKEWYIVDLVNWTIKLTEKSPQRAIESFKKWNEKIDEELSKK